MNSPHEHSPQDSAASIEALILQAGNFLEVDPFLRPEVVEQAQAVATCHTAWRRGAVVAVLLLGLTVPMALMIPNALSKRDAPARDLTKADPPIPLLQATSADFEQTANSIENADASWGFVRLFQQLQVERTRALRGTPRP